MKIFHCSNCQNLVFFENTQCIHCGLSLAYSPAQQQMVALDAGTADGPKPGPDALRLCINYIEHGVCNWALDPGDENALCISCRQTRIIPPLGRDEVLALWKRAETAKRRLIVNLLALGLPVLDSHPGDNDGMHFEFKEEQPGDLVLTGHHEGTITLNLLEADDVLRERLRAQFEEPYRTVLGHLRHESGHYYWDRLIRDGHRQDEFRSHFGDESVDYQDALLHHYQHGPRDDWANGFISAYASVHPWEDWAETWAHYLHLADTLETARGCGLTLRPRRNDEPELEPSPDLENGLHDSFESLIGGWFPVTYLLNNLSRGLGLADPYPFVLNPTVIEKLRFVHETIERARAPSQPDSKLEAA